MPQLTYECRIKLQAFNEEWYNQVRIAKKLWVNQSTVSREIWICVKLWVSYSAVVAQEYLTQQRINANINIHKIIIEWTALWLFIENKLKEFWSPENISNRWRIETWKNISHPTIYKYIYEYHPERITKYLRRRWKKNKRKTWWKSIIKNRVSIRKRPKEVETRERLWDFEWDTVLGSDTKDRFVTNVCRKARFLLADIILWNSEQSLSINTSTTMFAQLKKLPQEKVKTQTLDNWVEFADHEYLTEMLWIQTYFADPYSSYQRWTNEQTNWLLRRFYPKWTDFKKIDPEEFKKNVDKINHKPRKCLWFKTPYEVFYEKTISYI